MKRFWTLLFSSVLVVNCALGVDTAKSKVTPKARNIPHTSAIEIVPNGSSESDLRVRVWLRDNSYAIGEGLRIRIKPSRGSRIYVFFTDPAGATRRLFPNRYDQNNRVGAGETQSIPRGDSYSFELTPPPGTGTVTAYAIRDKKGAADNPDEEYWYDAYPPYRSPRHGMEHLIRNLADGRDYAVDSVKVPFIAYRKPVISHGRLSVTTSPSNASVYIDGRYAGATPYVNTRLQSGSHNVYIYKDGYETVSREIDIQKSETTRLSFRLQPDYVYPEYENYWW